MLIKVSFYIWRMEAGGLSGEVIESEDRTLFLIFANTEKICVLCYFVFHPILISFFSLQSNLLGEGRHYANWVSSDALYYITSLGNILEVLSILKNKICPILFCFFPGANLLSVLNKFNISSCQLIVFLSSHSQFAFLLWSYSSLPVESM